MTWQSSSRSLAAILVLVLCAPAVVGGAEPLEAPSELESSTPGDEAALWTLQAERQSPEGGSPASIARNELERAWFDGGPALGGRASAARRAALESGLHQAAGPARALIAPGGSGGDLGEALLAVKFAPELPIAHVALASVRWEDGERADAARSLISAVRAVPQNLEATLWLASSVLVLFAGVLVAGSIVFVAIVGAAAFPRAAHDLGDLVSARMPGYARAALLASIVLLPVALGEGVLGLAAALFALGLVYGGARHRMALALAGVLLVLGMFPVAHTAGRALSMLAADPVADAALAVRQGVQGPDQLTLLELAASEDGLAQHALAAHASHVGNAELALARYERLAADEPLDPVVTTNLANIYFRRGEVDEAMVLYQQASERLDSPVLWFNLSQAYARSFQLEAFEHALSRAQELGDAVVGELSQSGDPHFVADLPLPLDPIRDRMLARSRGAGFASGLRAPLAPGRLGTSWQQLAAALALLWIGAVAISARFEAASSCTRCGVRVCGRCDGTVWDSSTCDNCHRLFHLPETTDATLRAARLEELSRREARIGRASQIGSFLFPGVGGLLAGRPDLAFLAILFFGWAAAAIVWSRGVLPDPLVLGATGPLVLGMTALVAAMGYALLVLVSVSIRRSQ